MFHADKGRSGTTVDNYMGIIVKNSVKISILKDLKTQIIISSKSHNELATSERLNLAAT